MWGALLAVRFAGWLHQRGAPLSAVVEDDYLGPGSGNIESYRKLGSLPASPQVSGVMARVSDKTHRFEYIRRPG